MAIGVHKPLHCVFYQPVSGQHVLLVKVQEKKNTFVLFWSKGQVEEENFCVFFGVKGKKKKKTFVNFLIDVTSGT